MISSTYEPRDYICKIRQVNGTFFALAGISADPQTGYDVSSIARKALNGQGNLQDRVKYFESLVQPQLAKELRHIRNIDPALYETKYKNTIASLEIIFFGAEGNTLVYYVRGFRAGGDEEIRLEVDAKDCAANCDDATQIIPLGHRKVITKLSEGKAIAPQPELWMVARNLVKAEIDSGNPKIGGDIDVLRVTKKGRAGYVGLVPREPSRSTPVRAVNGHCPKCDFRFAWIVIRGRRRNLQQPTNRFARP